MEAVSACLGQESLVHLLIAAAAVVGVGADGSKLLLPLETVIAWTLGAALAAERIQWIGVVGQEIDREPILTSCVMPASRSSDQGGSTQQESVLRGLAGLPEAAEQVLIHDGARWRNQPVRSLRAGPGIGAGADRCNSRHRHDQAGGRQWCDQGRPSDQAWAAQALQGFQVEQLRQGHAQAEAKGWAVTDDASLYERLGAGAGLGRWAVQYQGDHTV